eukprot:scaffold2934_cov40-Attheya_sp.AAC.1
MTIVAQGNEKVSETIQDKWCHCKRHIRLTILVGLLILLKVDRSWHVKKGTQPHWNVKECASQGRRYILRLGHQTNVDTSLSFVCDSCSLEHTLSVFAGERESQTEYECVANGIT